MEIRQAEKNATKLIRKGGCKMKFYPKNILLFLVLSVFGGGTIGYLCFYFEIPYLIFLLLTGLYGVIVGTLQQISRFRVIDLPKKKLVKLIIVDFC